MEKLHGLAYHMLKWVNFNFINYNYNLISSEKGLCIYIKNTKKHKIIKIG